MANTSTKRSFESWWATVPQDLRQKARKGDDGNKPLLIQINYVLLHLNLAGKYNAKPTSEELNDWLHSGQLDVGGRYHNYNPSINNDNDIHASSYHSDLDQFYEENGTKSLLDWDKPLFGSKRSSLQKVLAHANKTIEIHK